ncbi:hypothetical protein E2C01_100775 [Portunus trituberculatus]|uniref:Uncharacterized protein n=1 Tax=Portunus trituberculatus TaxID=210409 RepID=A0A5B7KE67_PORTR|nr:hypothetical protein [Portunus trituberculatus]
MYKLPAGDQQTTPTRRLLFLIRLFACSSTLRGFVKVVSHHCTRSTITHPTIIVSRTTGKALHRL